MYRRALASIGLTGILMFSLLFVVRPAQAFTIDEIQSQIQTLLAKIADLTKQINTLQASPVATTAVSSSMPHRVCAILNRNLTRGVQGDDVSGLQEFLREQGYLSADATGYFGPLTAQGVAKWQTSEGISSVGSIGPLSRGRIKVWCGNQGKLQARPVAGQAPLAVNFAANVTLTNPHMVADAGDYKLVFGDGSEQIFSCASNAGTCPGPHTASHTYTSDGSYTATLIHYGYFGPPAQDGGAPSQVVGKVSIRVGSAVSCTKEYKPVCGAKQVVCIKAPCNPIPTTYGNRCMMNADGAVFLYEGACRDTSGNRPPVISGFSGPTTLAVSASGTWSIQASDPEGQSLSYAVTWGDEYQALSPYAGAAVQSNFVQTTTFTHSYAVAGAYTISVVVSDASGAQAKTTSTVRVGIDGVACTMEYAPVCGQPPEPACRHSIPACMMATPGPQTYGNHCMMQAVGATLLYEGQCQNTPVACTADAMQCPDGRWVGRTGPNCQFACSTY